jgi:hypothetical protein
VIDRDHLARLRAHFGPMRMISFALTAQQCRARTKTETRRTGWLSAKPGDHALGVSRVMGFRKGERFDDVADLFGVVRLVEVRREPLNAITQAGVIAEGFPDLDPVGFVRMFLGHHRGMFARDFVTVLRFAWCEVTA